MVTFERKVCGVRVVTFVDTKYSRPSSEMYLRKSDVVKKLDLCVEWWHCGARFRRLLRCLRSLRNTASSSWPRGATPQRRFVKSYCWTKTRASCSWIATTLLACIPPPSSVVRT
jgi:hypothetical protein